jgi:hypothetical protein
LLTCIPIAHANRPSRWRLCISYSGQCHDLVRYASSFPARDTVHRLYALFCVPAIRTHAEEHSCAAQLLIIRRNAVIIGPADTPFEDGTFRLVMHFEEAYPNKPPGVKFISQMFHPNVYGTGELCLDILQNRWSPTYDVAAVLTSIQRYA